MTLDLEHFTPWMSLGGGVLLGIASVMLMLLNGRILGISSILGGLLKPSKHDIIWRLVFLLGLCSASWFLKLVNFSAISLTPTIATDDVWVILAGLLVGIGTRWGSGCTSGHGICGLSRGSMRSFVATCSFMAGGFIVVALIQHGI